MPSTQYVPRGSRTPSPPHQVYCSLLRTDTREFTHRGGSLSRNQTLRLDAHHTFGGGPPGMQNAWLVTWQRLLWLIYHSLLPFPLGNTTVSAPRAAGSESKETTDWGAELRLGVQDQGSGRFGMAVSSPGAERPGSSLGSLL